MLLILTVQEQINKKKPWQPKKPTHTPSKQKRNSKNKSAYINGEKTRNHVSQTAEDGNPILNKNSGARSTSH